jgi:hypothetical protein
MAVIQAVNYRERAGQLREAAAQAPSDLLRDKLASLAAQYECLAASLEKALAPWPCSPC